jgi:inositol phosphorylceramide mannosyltransferase catalytic subunit
MTAGEQLIPRVIHRVWLGPDPVPEVFDQYAESWRRHHREWEVRLWRDEDLPELSSQSEFERTRGVKLRFDKSRYDMTRLELLCQVGGVIIDLDVEALRPIDPLLPGVSAFVGRVSSGDRVGNQIIGAVPQHPFLVHAVERLRETVGTDDTSSQRAGSGFVSRMVQERPEGVTIFPRDYFYSPLTIEPPQRPQEFPEIYAVHHSTESYREGPEGEIVRLERQLRRAEREILRLQIEAGEGPDVPADHRDAKTRLALVTGSRWWRLGRRLGITKIDA